jgi:hypothetical protein
MNPKPNSSCPGKESQTLFLVTGNVNLGASGEFLVCAKDRTVAEKTGQKLLDNAWFQISTEPSVTDVFVHIPDCCTDCEIMEVELLQHGWVFDSEAIRSNVVVSIGDLILREIERLRAAAPQEFSHGSLLEPQ